MNKIYRKYLIVISAMILLTAAVSLQGMAAGPVDTSKGVNLTITFYDGAINIPGARFELYRAADMDVYSNLTLTPRFEEYKSSVTGLDRLDEMTEETWLELASTLKGYIYEDSPENQGSAITNEEGKATYQDLVPGLYLIIGYPAVVNGEYVYCGVPFFAYLPEADQAANSWNYDVTLRPKYTKVANMSEDTEKVTRKVLKVWDDKGFESKRPSEINVSLYCDGEEYDTQTLTAEDSWRYTWEYLEDGHEYTVVEKKLDNYTVNLAQEGITFTLTNKYADAQIAPSNSPTPSQRLPQTGLLWWPAVLMMFFGILFLAIGLVKNRNYRLQKAEEALEKPIYIEDWK